MNTPFLNVNNLINLDPNSDQNADKKTSSEINYELAWRLKMTSIKNDKFFTDLNGFQVSFFN